MMGAVLLIAALGCVSHRYVLNAPVSAVNPWERLDATEPGTEIDVQLKDGTTISGTFRGSTADGVAITPDVGSAIEIAKVDIRRVATARPDSLAEGAVFGALGGTLLGLLSTQAAGNAGDAAKGFASNVAFFTGLGIFLDWRSQEHELLYGEPE